MYINQLDDGTINLTAPVLIPYAKDCDYKNGETPLNPEQITAFKESYDKYGFVDHEHGLTRDGRKIGEPSESIILDQDTTFTLYDGTTRSYPVGTWMLTTHITDETAIVEAMKGYYTGYSPSILPRASADKYLAALKAGKGNDCACKNQVSSMGNSLIKDVPDPVVLSVSLTRQPCLHESKFCELNGETMEEEVSLKSKILTAMGMTEEAEVLALKAEIKDLDAKIEAMQNEFQKSLEALQADFKQILTDALKPVEEEPAEEETEPEEVAEKAEAEPTEEEDAEVEVEEEVEEETTEEPVEEVEEEPIEEEPIAEKGESKQEPVHDNIEAEKSVKTNIYEIMGRNPNGTAKRH
jgi:hypothetical protein